MRAYLQNGMSAPHYGCGEISIGPGSTCGELGSIIVVCGMPGGQLGGGQHLSPRLNQPPLDCRQLLQPARFATASAKPATKNTFFDMTFLLRTRPIVRGCVLATLALGSRGANAAEAFSQHWRQGPHGACRSFRQRRLAAMPFC